MTVTIFHNPDCGTSRNTLHALEAAGASPTVVEYLKTPPSREVVRDLAGRVGVSLREILRQRGTPYASLGLDDPTLSDDVLLDAVDAHPILLNRPIVVTSLGAILCRPSDVVFDLVASPATDVLKEDGAPFLRDESIGVTDDLLAGLIEAGLPTDDVDEPGRHFFRYRTLAGQLAGFGGFERYGEDILVRSIAVPEGMRRRRIGRNLLLLLLRRAQEAGARNAYLLTNDAAPFFEASGFRSVAREAAPSPILTSRQATSLCPATAALMARTISL